MSHKIILCLRKYIYTQVNHDSYSYIRFYPLEFAPLKKTLTFTDTEESHVNDYQQPFR